MMRPTQFINRKESQMKTHVQTMALLLALAPGAVLAASQSLAQVELTASTRDDAVIAANVRQKINEHPSLRFFDINVRSVDHTVYLEGQVDTPFDSAEARRIAEAVPGVKTVYDDLYLHGN
jgi:osmotically-inducible protein OsmY